MISAETFAHHQFPRSERDDYKTVDILGACSGSAT